VNGLVLMVVVVIVMLADVRMMHPSIFTIGGNGGNGGDVGLTAARQAGSEVAACSCTELPSRGLINGLEIDLRISVLSRKPRLKISRGVINYEVKPLKPSSNPP
jgi:NAD(P)H-hydrate repair Nnr-like enzyme with NAD(P)H-hydrate epimerase domain